MRLWSRLTQTPVPPVIVESDAEALADAHARLANLKATADMLRLIQPPSPQERSW